MAGQAKGGNMSSTKRGINSIEDLNEAAGFVLDIIKTTYGDDPYLIKSVLDHANHSAWMMRRTKDLQVRQQRRSAGN
jgi:hypothetical protein